MPMIAQTSMSNASLYGTRDGRSWCRWGRPQLAPSAV